MKRIASLSLLSILAILVVGCCTGVQYEKIEPSEVQAITIQELLDAMKDDLAGIKDYATSKGMRLEQIELRIPWFRATNRDRLRSWS